MDPAIQLSTLSLCLCRSEKVHLQLLLLICVPTASHDPRTTTANTVPQQHCCEQEDHISSETRSRDWAAWHSPLAFVSLPCPQSRLIPRYHPAPLYHHFEGAKFLSTLDTGDVDYKFIYMGRSSGLSIHFGARPFILCLVLGKHTHISADIPLTHVIQIPSHSELSRRTISKTSRSPMLLSKPLILRTPIRKHPLVELDLR